MKEFRSNMLTCLRNRTANNNDGFWHKFNDVIYEAGNDATKEKVLNFFDYVYSPYYRHWQEKELAQKYEDSFLNLLEDFLADESLEKIEDSKLFVEFKKVQDIIAADMKKYPWKYYNGDIPW